MGENAVIPAEADIQVFKSIVEAHFLDARFHGHDGLRHSLKGERGPSQLAQPSRKNILFMTFP
jgi:hypothetical protein